MTRHPQTLFSEALLLAAACLAAGCGDSEKPPAVSAPTPPAAAGAPADAAKPAKAGYVEEDVANGGAIEGTLAYGGEAPAPFMRAVPLNMQKDCGVQSPDQRKMLSVDKETKGVLHAVVFLDKIAGGKKKPAGPIVLDQLQCVYMPHVVVATVGAQVMFKNTDKAVHNVHVNAAKNDSFNEIIPPGHSRPWLPTFAENDRVSCDIHDWMESWIVVKEHPYAAVTDEKGRFKLEDVPPGEYTLKVWHEKLAPQSTVGVKVKVEAGRTAKADLPPLTAK